MASFARCCKIYGSQARIKRRAKANTACTERRELPFCDVPDLQSFSWLRVFPAPKIFHVRPIDSPRAQSRRFTHSKLCQEPTLIIQEKVELGRIMKDYQLTGQTESPMAIVSALLAENTTNRHPS
jgi:hypothetical protein